MTQTHSIRINGKTHYFYAPIQGGMPRVFPAHRDILIAYMRKFSKNRYEVVIAYKDRYGVYSNCDSIKQACQVLQIAYNG